MRNIVVSGRVLLAISGAIIVTMLMAFSAKSQTVDSAVLAKTLDKKAAILLQSSEAVSVQYAVIDQGKIVVSGQAGGRGEALTNTTVYGIGSVSKMFAAVAVMKLVEAGKVNLDTPVYQYIHDFTMKDERYKQITPRMLLNHSSGLRGTEAVNDALFADNDPHVHDTLLPTLAGQTLNADPGAFSVYCNSGFTLAEILVERVSGMGFTQFIHRYVTEPLQLQHTYTPQDDLSKQPLAGFYVPGENRRLPDDVCNAIASGGIYSTAEDMARFAQIFMANDNHLLSPGAIAAMASEEYKRGLWPADADDSSNYGLGWDSVQLYPFTEYGIKAVAKGGDLATYAAAFVVLPEKNMAAVVLTAGGNSSANQLLASKMLLAALKAKGEIKDIKKNKAFGEPRKANMPAALRSNAGYYASSDEQLLVSINSAGELFFAAEPDVKYTYTADGWFANQDGSCQLRFVNEKNGRTYLWKRAYDTIPGLGQSATSEYMAEKLAENPLTPETAKAWRAREGQRFYIVNHKFTADAYLFQYPVIKVETADGMPGYWADRKIIDADTAVSQIQIPGLAGRDTTEAHFYQEHGVEYWQMGGYVGISEKMVTPLSTASRSLVIIPANGQAKWHTVSPAIAGRRLRVTLPPQGAFAVYDGQERCMNYSLVNGSNTTVLPAQGTIVFAGEPGAEFTLHIE